MTLTEFEAVTALARAWNRLDPTEFLSLLASDVHYASQRVLEELETKEAVSHYLKERMRIMAMNSPSDPNLRVFAAMGKTTSGVLDRDCVIIAQGSKEHVVAVILLEVDGREIRRIDLCIPELLMPVHNGVYPR